MARKLSILIVVFLMLGLVKGAAAVTWTNADPADELWSTPGNWSGAVPGSETTAILDNPDVNGPLIEDGVTAVCNRFKGPGYSIPPGSDLTITGGSLRFNRYWRIGFGAGAGTVNMSGGTVTNGCNYAIYMNAGSTFNLSGGLLESGLWIPSELSGGSAVSTLNMTGGTINSNAEGIELEMSFLSIGVEGAGPGLVKLHGGTIIVHTFIMDAQNLDGLCDITEGKLVIDDDVTSTIEGYVNKGLITAYGGTGLVLYTYDDVNNVTVVTGAQVARLAHSPTPQEHADDACPDAVLQWVAGEYAEWHDVYFGTDFNSVRDATTSQTLDVYMQRQSAGDTDFDPAGHLDWGTTYYWRIDEISDILVKGRIWSFTVASGKAHNPSPPDLQWRVPVDVNLEWEAGCLASSHQVYLGTDKNAVAMATPARDEYKGSVSQAGYAPPGLEPETTYYWRIDEVSPGTTIKGDVWSFTTTTAGQTLLMCDVSRVEATLKEGWTLLTKYEGYPQPEAEDYESDDLALTWTDVNAPDGNSTDIDVTIDVGASGSMGGRSWGGEPLGMDYFFANDQSGTPDTDIIITLGDLIPGTYVLTTFHNSTWYGYPGGPINEIAVTGGVSYSAVLTPLPVMQTSSVLDAAICHVEVEFQAAGEEDVTIRYKVGEAGAVHLNGFVLDYFAPDTRYAYWPVPHHSARNVQPNVIFSWRPGDYAVSHDVYLGTSFQDVNEADRSSTDIYKGNQLLDANSYDPGGLTLNTTYYWRVDEINDANADSPWKGTVWNFTVAEYLVVDDMESYCPGEVGACAIMNNWLDGFDNFSGSTVRLGTKGTFPVRDGEQSMEFSYDNDGEVGGWPADEYSETELALDPAEDLTDWMAPGMKALRLYFYGDPNNDANEQMYVGLEDSGNTYAEVRYGSSNGEDMNDVKKPRWQQWNIELSHFAGVDLANVRKIYIGFGDRENPKAGRGGVVYFDDIRAYPRTCVAHLLKPAADLNYDCVVDLGDLEVMAQEWLESDIAFDDWSEPSATGLVGWWKLDDGSGDMAVDSSGQGNDGTLEGRASWAAGHDGGALKFDGGRVFVPDAPQLRPSDVVSVCAWAYFSQEQISARVVVKGADNRETFGLEVDDSEDLVFHVRDVNNNRFAADGSGLDIDEWNHVAGTFDGDVVTCYINGILAADNNEPNNMTLSQDPNGLGIGNRSDDDNRPFNGIIDDVRVYSRVLSVAELAYLASDGTGLVSMQSPANLHDTELPGSRAVNFKDYAVLINAWLERKLWPE